MDQIWYDLICGTVKFLFQNVIAVEKMIQKIVKQGQILDFPSYFQPSQLR